MPVSKRLRYEILRRDNHACRYCGRAAPDVKLTVDHVVPTALGGTDEPGNLVTACAECNAGKSSSNPDAPLVDDVAADALRWSKAMAEAAEAMLADYDRRAALRQEFLTRWEEWTFGDGSTAPLPAGWPTTVDNLLAAGLPMPILLECIDIAMGNTKVRLDNVFRYMCGAAWNRVTELQDAARSIAEPGQGAPPADTNQDDADDTAFCYRIAVERLFLVLGGKHCNQLRAAAVYHLGGTDEDGPDVVSFWMLYALASEVALAYLQGLQAREREAFGWTERADVPIDFRAINAANRARKFNEEGLISNGRCQCVLNGLPCPAAADYNIWLAACRWCEGGTCRGHHGLCEPHLEEAIGQGVRDRDGNVVGVLIDYHEVRTPDGVSA